MNIWRDVVLKSEPYSEIGHVYRLSQKHKVKTGDFTEERDLEAYSLL